VGRKRRHFTTRRSRPPLVIASVCGELCRKAEAASAVNELLAIDPEFAVHARRYIEPWHYASGLMDQSPQSRIRDSRINTIQLITMPICSFLIHRSRREKVRETLQNRAKLTQNCKRLLYANRPDSSPSLHHFSSRLQ
jgi:hypothetical protein